jgi:hypothetical protein
VRGDQVGVGVGVGVFLLVISPILKKGMAGIR